MTDPSIVRRLASACCQGWRQQSLVNELLVRPVTRTLIPVPNGVHGMITAVYGDTRLQTKSFKNLKARLAAVGFVFKTTVVDREHALVTMTFPEATNQKETHTA